MKACTVTLGTCLGVAERLSVATPTGSSGSGNADPFPGQRKSKHDPQDGVFEP